MTNTLKKDSYHASTALKWPESVSHASKSDSMVCRYCGNSCWKSGIEKNGKQRYKCKSCHKHQQTAYMYSAYRTNVNETIKSLTKEGVGIRGTARLLGISQGTVISRIKKIATLIQEPALVKGKHYEVDELKTFVKKKSG
jgi:insertion element IS1 protein InsB